MKKYVPLLTRSPLLEGISAADIPLLLQCLLARTAAYGREQTIFALGACPHEIGLVLEGSVNIIKEDSWGNRSLLQKIGPGEVFAESFVCSGEPALLVSVVAADDCRVLFLDGTRLSQNCSLMCAFHTRLTQNVMRLLAAKNVALTMKIEHVSMRTTREKLLSYLSHQALRAGDSAFRLPLNRQELADYLCVDRSAMCAALSRLKREGLIDYGGRSIRLLQADAQQVAL